MNYFYKIFKQSFIKSYESYSFLYIYFLHFLIMGVLLLELYKSVLRCVKLFFIHPLVKLKTLSIFSALCLFRANYFIILKNIPI